MTLEILIGVAVTLLAGVLVALIAIARALRRMETEPDEDAARPDPKAPPAPVSAVVPSLVVVEDVDVRAAVGDAIEAQLLYEEEHGKRQVERMRAVHPKLMPSRPSAPFDPDQRLTAVIQRTRATLTANGLPLSGDIRSVAREMLAKERP